MCTYYHIVDHLVLSFVLRCVLIITLVTIWYKYPRVKVCTYYHIGDHLVQALVLRCVLITTLVTIW